MGRASAVVVTMEPSRADQLGGQPQDRLVRLSDQVAANLARGLHVGVHEFVQIEADQFVSRTRPEHVRSCRVRVQDPLEIAHDRRPWQGVERDTTEPGEHMAIDGGLWHSGLRWQTRDPAGLTLRGRATSSPLCPLMRAGALHHKRVPCPNVLRTRDCIASGALYSASSRSALPPRTASITPSASGRERSHATSTTGSVHGPSLPKSTFSAPCACTISTKSASGRCPSV